MACLSGHSTISLLNLCGWVLGVYLMCLTGQRIQTQSLSIADAVYDMEWYKANPKLRKDIYFMMIRAQKPLLFQCGILGNFHFITFKNIMSTAYRFTTLKTGFSG
nr:odorant receptor 2a-like [Onthophagus taurus]